MVTVKKCIHIFFSIIYTASVVYSGLQQLEIGQRRQRSRL